MALVGMVLVWLLLVLAGSMIYSGGHPVPMPVLAGLLLRHWNSTETPTFGELMLISVGRIGSLFLLAALIRVIWIGNWLEASSAAALLVVGMVAMALFGRERAALPGLAWAQVLLRQPDDYLFLIGRVAATGPLCGASLAALDLRKQGLLILAIEHKNGERIHFPKGQETLKAQDLVLIYGRFEAM